MPGPDLISRGFWGKLPGSGDFVGRGLPPSFLRPWDRWVTCHLAPRLATSEPGRVPHGFDALRQDPAFRPAAREPLFFLLSAASAMTGVVLASADRAGRRYPLTLAAELPAAGRDLPETAAPWFAALAELGTAAASGELNLTALGAALDALPLPEIPPGPSAPSLLLWTLSRPPREADLMVPEPVLDALLGVAEAA